MVTIIFIYCCGVTIVSITIHLLKQWISIAKNDLKKLAYVCITVVAYLSYHCLFDFHFIKANFWCSHMNRKGGLQQFWCLVSTKIWFLQQEHSNIKNYEISLLFRYHDSQKIKFLPQRIQNMLPRQRSSCWADIVMPTKTFRSYFKENMHHHYIGQSVNSTSRKYFSVKWPLNSTMKIEMVWQFL